MASVPASTSSSNQFLGETSSTCLTHSVTVAHKFRVPDFSLLEGMGAGKHVSSCSFTVGGCDWCLKVYPDGRTVAEKAAHVSVYLCLLQGPTGVRVKLRLGLLCQDGNLRPRGPVLSKTFVSDADRECGVDRFISKVDLQDFMRNYSNGDCFTVRCALTVVKESQSSSEDNKIAVPPTNLCQDYARMLKKKEGADVTFSVDGHLFPAHRCVLAARSPFFQAEFFGPMKKEPSSSDMIMVADDIKPTIFEAILHFVYTDSLPDGYCNDEDVTVWQHLLVAADLYGLERLRLICEDRLCRSIDVQTVASTFALAERHNCVQLKEKCLEFIASQAVLGAVMETDGFKELAASRPAILKEILDKVAIVKG